MTNVFTLQSEENDGNVMRSEDTASIVHEKMVD